MPTPTRARATPVRSRDLFEARFPVAFAAAEGPGGSGPARFEGLAYSGGTFPQWFGQACIDLAGLEELPEGRTLGLLLNHGFSAQNPRVGVVRRLTKSAQGVTVAGDMLANASASEIVADARGGYPFEMSLQTTVLERRELAAGESAQVNGRTINGPCTIATRSVVREVSVTELGADRATRFALAASALLAQDAHPEVPPEVPAGTTGEDEEDDEDTTKEPIMAEPDPKKEPAAPPVTDTKARLAQIRALTNNDDALTLKAFEEGWDDARVFKAVHERLSARCAAAEREAADLKARLKLAGEAAAAPPVEGGPPPPANPAGGFKGVLGKDPSADWSASETLRAHWSRDFKGDETRGRAAFMRFALNQKDRGEPWTDPV